MLSKPYKYIYNYYYLVVDWILDLSNEAKMSKKEKKDLEDSWVYDSLVGFLRGPVWHVPVMTFIEQKSLSKYLLPDRLFSLLRNT